MYKTLFFKQKKCVLLAFGNSLNKHANLYGEMNLMTYIL